MRPLLQHVSRSLVAGAPSIRIAGGLAGSVCWRCQYRTGHEIQVETKLFDSWNRRTFASSRVWRDEGKPPNSSQPIPVPRLPADSEPQHTSDNRAAFTDSPSLKERQERLQREFDEMQRQAEEQKVREKARKLQEEEDARRAQERIQQQRRQREEEEQARLREQSKAEKSIESETVEDNIARVPDEYLPSHRERQRWNLSKRLSDAMDDLLPKIALVTQKVNTYTGTDYSGVQALRREIKEQEQLVKARRLAIDSKKQALDTALAHQAASQKEVVALLERKHSWSSSDLERYMSLIRSEHINDQAVREGKDAVTNAEKALEEARAQLEKRERAQYHEEQIWSDTIRRNSTWVTFGLMGVNIFLLLLSLAVLEPWRRKRMVREINTALEAQIIAMKTHPASVTAIPAASAALAQQEVASMAEESPVGADSATESFKSEPVGQVAQPMLPDPSTESPSSPSSPSSLSPVEPTPDASVPPEPLFEPSPDPVVPDAAPPLFPQEDQPTPQNIIEISEEEPSSQPDPRALLQRWQRSATAIALDVVSDRVIAIRRIDYTAAVLQGAAAGAVITAAIIAMVRGN